MIEPGNDLASVARRKLSKLPNAEIVVSTFEDLRLEKPVVRTYLSEETYSRAEYLDLLSTYSGHRALESKARQALFDCIGSLIDRFGGQVRKRFINYLVVTRRRS